MPEPHQRAHSPQLAAGVFKKKGESALAASPFSIQDPAKT
jgi:hypothetical protein